MCVCVAGQTVSGREGCVCVLQVRQSVDVKGVHACQCRVCVWGGASGASGQTGGVNPGLKLGQSPVVAVHPIYCGCNVH